jgi:hypothetical protein
VAAQSHRALGRKRPHLLLDLVVRVLVVADHLDHDFAALLDKGKEGHRAGLGAAPRRAVRIVTGVALVAWRAADAALFEPPLERRHFGHARRIVGRFTQVLELEHLGAILRILEHRRVDAVEGLSLTRFCMLPVPRILQALLGRPHTVLLT